MESFVLAASSKTNTSPSTSTDHSISTDATKNMTNTNHDEAFISTSTNGTATTSTSGMSLRYLANVVQALPNAESKYHERLAVAIKDAKLQHVVSFLKMITYLDGTYHLDEIAALTDMSRIKVLSIIENFQSIVIPALHPDPNPILQI